MSDFKGGIMGFGSQGRAVKVFKEIHSLLGQSLPSAADKFDSRSQKILNTWKNIAKEVKGAGAGNGGGTGGSGGSGGGSLGLGLAGFSEPRRSTVMALGVGSAMFAMAPDVNDAVAQRIAARSAGVVAGMSPQAMVKMTNGMSSGGMTGTYSMQLAAANMLYQGGLVAGQSGFSNIMRQVGSLSAMTGISNEQMAGSLSAMNGMRGLQLGVQIRDGRGQLLPPSQIADRLWNRMYGNRTDITPADVAVVYNPGSRAYQNVMALANGDPTVFQAIAAALMAKAKNKGRTAPLNNADKTMSLMGMGANDPSRNVMERTAAQAKVLQKNGDAAVTGFNAAQDTIRLANNAFAALPGAVTNTITALKGFQTALGGFSAVLGTLMGAAMYRPGGMGGIPLLPGKGGGGGGAGVTMPTPHSGGPTGIVPLAAGPTSRINGAKGMFSRFLSGPKSMMGLLGRGLLAYGAYKGLDYLQSKIQVGPSWLRKAGNFAFDVGQGALSGLLMGGPAGAVYGSAMGGVSSIISPYGDPVPGPQGGNGEGSAVSTQASGVGNLVSNALSFVHKVPYIFGGKTEKGWDCSGFVQTIYARAGISLPRTAAQQSRRGTPVGSLADARPGDLLFFRYGRLGNEVDHVAIYIGGGKMVEAANQNAGTRVSNVPTRSLAGIRRVLGSTVGKSYNNLMEALKGRGVNIVGNTGDKGAPFGVEITAAGIRSLGAATLSALTGLDSRGATISTLMGTPSGGTNDWSGGYDVSSGGYRRSTDAGARYEGRIGLPVNSKSDLVNVLRQAGFSGDGLTMAYAVAMAESGGRSTAFNGKGRDRSYGLFQINMLGSLGPARREKFGLARNEDLYDPLTNAKVAYHMTAGGQNWSHWSTYTNGSYKKFLNSYDKGSYRVTHDQVANIHKDEMIVPADEARKIRSGVMGANVTINLTVQNSSDAEALKFARRVKQIIEQDSYVDGIGRY